VGGSACPYFCVCLFGQHLRLEMLSSTFARADYFGFVDDTERFVPALHI